MSQADSTIVVNPQNWDKYTKVLLKTINNKMDIDQGGCNKLNEFLHLVTQGLLNSIYKSKTSISENNQDHELIMNQSDEITKQSVLTFDVGTVFNVLNENSFQLQFEFLFYIGFSTILEYLSAEILELSANHAVTSNKTIVSAEFVEMTIENDEEIKDLFQRINN